MADTTAARRGKAPTPKGWTAAEITAVRDDLEAQLTQLREDYRATMVAIDQLQSQSDTAGEDMADAGSRTFEREHEMSLANNRRDLIDQLDHALARVQAGEYGKCESCGEPIAKARLQAFPGATLCVTCKQRAERR